ncbi:MAG: MazG nucleotide pyrophosphohydrolase domain-containing protein [Candidatus Omnitrophota bacterium]
MTKFIELKKIFKILHGKNGCDWDRKQTYRTLIPQLKEEVDEYIAAVRKNDTRHMKEELGDILLHVMFAAQIASREKKFDAEDVIDTLIKKLKRRHPHVFAGLKVRSTRQIIANWNRIKSGEKESRQKVTRPAQRSRLPENIVAKKRRFR